MPLAFAPLNKTFKVVRCRVDNEVKKHLTDLGIIAGEDIISLSDSNGNLIIQIKEGRVAINKDLALKIDVA